MSTPRNALPFLIFAILIFVALPFLIFNTPSHAATAVHTDTAAPIVLTSAALALRSRRSVDKEAIFRRDEKESEKERGATFGREQEQEEEEEEEEEDDVSFGFGTYPPILTYTSIPINTQRTIIPNLATSQNSRGYGYALVLPLPLLAFVVATPAIFIFLFVVVATVVRRSNRLIRGRANYWVWIVNILILILSLWWWFLIPQHP